MIDFSTERRKIERYTVHMHPFPGKMTALLDDPSQVVSRYLEVANLKT